MKERFKKIRTAGTITIKLKELGRVWTAPKVNIMAAIVQIAESYKSQGYKLTLRQLYYQLVARDMIPNHDTVYKKIGALKDDCVYGGLIDWETFEDRGRIPKQAYFEDSVKGALQRAQDYYALDRQLGQENHIEVWTEKDAISDILYRVAAPLTVRLVVNKGYSSSTAMYSSYKRFINALQADKKIKILYFGDHDPSGLDMVRDISDRILFFMREGDRKYDLYKLVMDWNESDEGREFYEDHVYDEAWNYVDEDGREVFDDWKAFFVNHFEIKHIGLTMTQIEKYRPPYNPAKITDSRADKYIAQFGQKSWEVDALEPKVMTEIVEAAIWAEMDQEAYDAVMLKESEDIAKITEIIENIENTDEDETD